jgi:hypothetical protein
MTVALRHRCRNPKCRTNLPAPVESKHRAFCVRGCYERFYRNRCRVCERDLRKKAGKDAGRRYCRPPNKCRLDAAKWPGRYEYAPRATCTTRPSRSAHFTGLKTGLGADLYPSFHCLRHWRWTAEVDLELELHDGAGGLLARLEHNGGRYRLTYPKTIPVMSWPDDGEDLAKHRAEAVALNSLPLIAGLSIEAAELGRTNASNSKPNPMGPPLNRPWPSAEASGDFKIREACIDSDPEPIPEFLRRTA